VYDSGATVALIGTATVVPVAALIVSDVDSPDDQVVNVAEIPLTVLVAQIGYC